jgi:hypothetical protein
MKVYINNYREHWLSPYTVLEKVFFWKKEIDYDDPTIVKWANRLEPASKALLKFLDFVHPKINYIKIDKWDTWSMDSTLAQIILPMLKQLKDTKHGAPFVDDEDVPEELRSTSAPPKENEYDTDENHFKRWDWVLDEMIQAFECKVNEDWEEQYSTGECNYIFVKEESDPNFSRMVEGPNHTRKTDWDALKAHSKRNKNGYRLFGKYYEGLWD